MPTQQTTFFFSFFNSLGIISYCTQIFYHFEFPNSIFISNRLNADPDTNPFNPKQKSSEETVDTDAYKATPQYHSPTQYYKPTPQYKSPSQYYKPAPTPYLRPTLPQYYQPNSDYWNKPYWISTRCHFFCTYLCKNVFQ